MGIPTPVLQSAANFSINMIAGGDHTEISYAHWLGMTDYKAGISHAGVMCIMELTKIERDGSNGLVTDVFPPHCGL